MDVEHVRGIAERLCKRKEWSIPVYIDCGASAAVFQTTVAGEPAALKIYDPGLFQDDNALIEESRISLQQQLIGHGCPYLVEVRAADKISEDGTWYLLMDFCPWTSLEKRLPDVPDTKVHGIVKQIVKAVLFLENLGLVHRDIKPANIVVSPDYEHAKLLDFGVLRRIAHDEGSGTDTSKFVATAQYSPPEFLTREEKSGEAGYAAINIYQIGALLHDLIAKSALFGKEKATRNKFILFKAVTERMPRLVSASVPPRLIALAIAALEKNPTTRIKSVNLNDFLAGADDLAALRKRIARAPGAKASASVAVSVWKSKIRSWGSAAAQLEAEALGAVTMKVVPTSGGVMWQLDFRGATAPIYLAAVRLKDHLSVQVRSSLEQNESVSVFSIFLNGPDIPELGIPSVLAAQYLYALDLAIVGQAASQAEDTVL